MADMNEWVDSVMLANMGKTGWNGSLESKAYIEAKQQITAKMQEIEREARIETLQWALNDYNMSDTDTKANLEQYIAELSQKEEK